MPITRRIFVSMPADQWLTPGQNALKWGVVQEIEALGYHAEIFIDPRGKPGLAAAKAWSADEVDRVMRRCMGAAILGFPRWEFLSPQGNIMLPTEYCHYEAAVACTLGLPMLVLAQKGMVRRVVFDASYRGYLGTFPVNASKSWLKKPCFLTPFAYWKEELGKRRDVFMGYSSTSSPTAQKLKRFLKTSLKLNVLSWQSDFTAGRSILDQIEQAASLCTAGIFLFTKDDKLKIAGSIDIAAPRDNVVLEAGYFIHAKGKDHVLLIREAGAKMPADLGGDIYLPLDHRTDIEPLKGSLRKFIDAL